MQRPIKSITNQSSVPATTVLNFRLCGFVKGFWFATVCGFTRSPLILTLGGKMSRRHPSNIRDFGSTLIAYGGVGLILWLLLSWLLVIVPLIGPDESFRSPFVVPGLLAMERHIFWVILVTGTVTGCTIALLLLVGGTIRRIGFELLGSFLGFIVPYFVSIGAGLYQADVLFPAYAPDWALIVCGLIPGIAFPRLLVRVAAPIRRGWES